MSVCCVQLRSLQNILDFAASSAGSDCIKRTVLGGMLYYVCFFFSISYSTHMSTYAVTPICVLLNNNTLGVKEFSRRTKRRYTVMYHLELGERRRLQVCFTKQTWKDPMGRNNSLRVWKFPTQIAHQPSEKRLKETCYYENQVKQVCDNLP